MVSLPINLDSLRFSSSFSSLKRRVSPSRAAADVMVVRYPGGTSGAPMCFPNGAPQPSRQKPVHEGSRDPALAPHTLGRGSRFATMRDFPSGALLPPSPPAEKATASEDQAGSAMPGQSGPGTTSAPVRRFVAVAGSNHSSFSGSFPRKAIEGFRHRAIIPSLNRQDGVDYLMRQQR